MEPDCSGGRAQDGQTSGSTPPRGWRPKPTSRLSKTGPRRGATDRDIDPLDELMRIVSETPARPPYRIQFVARGAERGTSILKEVRLNAIRPVRSRPRGLPS